MESKIKLFLDKLNSILADVQKEEKGKDRIECVHKWNMGYRKRLGNIIAEACECACDYTPSISFIGGYNNITKAKEGFEFAYDFLIREGNKAYNTAYAFKKPTAGVFNARVEELMDMIEENINIK